MPKACFSDTYWCLYVNEARGGALPALEWVMGDEWPRLVLTRPVKAGEELLVDSYTPQLA